MIKARHQRNKRVPQRVEVHNQAIGEVIDTGVLQKGQGSALPAAFLLQ